MQVFLIIACCLVGLVDKAMAEETPTDFINEAGRIFVGELIKTDSKWLSDRQAYVFKVNHWIAGQGKESPSAVTVETNLSGQIIGEEYLVAQHIVEDSLIAMVPIADDSTLPDRIEARINKRIHEEAQLFALPLRLTEQLQWTTSPIRVYTTGDQPLMDLPYTSTTVFYEKTQKSIEIKFIKGATGKKLAPYISYEAIEVSQNDASQKTIRIKGRLSRGERFDAVVSTSENVGEISSLDITPSPAKTQP